MKREALHQTTEYAATHRRRRRWQTVVTCLAAVVVFCTTYALILPAITLEAETVCGLEEHTHTESCYTQEQLIVCGLEESEEHTHEADCFQTEARLTCGLEEHTHTEECYAGEEPDVPPEPDVSAPENEPAAGGSTSGESALPEDAAGETPHLYSYEDDAVSVSVALAEGAEVPADAELRVTPISAGDGAYDYDALAARAEETVSGEVSQIALYDISFFAPETGEYIPVSDAATVTFRFKEALFPEDAEEVAVLHYAGEDAPPVALEEVSVQRDGADGLYGLTFQTEGFSVYAVVLLDDTGDGGTPAAQSEGSSFTLTYNGYKITFNIVDANGNPIQGTYEDIVAQAATRYVFGEKAATTADTDTVEENIAPEIVGYNYTGAKYNNNDVFSLATGGYKNDVGGEVGIFRFYGTEPLEETQFYTVNNGVTATLVYTSTEADYSGDWAIVNTGTGANTAMLADFTGQTVDMTTGGGAASVVDSGVTVWQFEKQDDGTYYISTQIDGVPKYLSIGADGLSLSDTAQSIHLEQGTDSHAGQLLLTDASGTYAVSLSNGAFTATTTDGASDNEYQSLYPVLTGGDFLIYDDNNYVVVNLVDQNGDKLSDDILQSLSLENIKLTENQKIYFKNIIGPDKINGYTFTEAQLVQKNVVVEYVTTTTGNQFRFYNAAGLFWTNGGASTVNLVYSQNNSLRYDLNLPSLSSKGTGWQTTPTLPGDAAQIVTADAAALYAQPEGFYPEPGTAGIPNLYRFDVNDVNNLNKLTGTGFTWYGEERFDGWAYTAGNGTVYLLDPEATVTWNEDGAMTVSASKQIVTGEDKTESIETIAEVPLTLPAGAALRGHWTEVSNVVTFYVNYKGTILDTEGDVTGRRSDTFTLSVAVGHVYFGKLKVGVDNTFAANASTEITAAFRPDFDPDTEETQIVVEYLRVCTVPSTTGENYVTAIDPSGDAYGANSQEVEAATLKLLQETGRTIQVATGTGANPTIDSSLCDTDHYQIRWYVMKEQTDTWHIDGVLVAKTAEIAVTKTFTGLDDATVDRLMDYDTESGSGSFRIPVALGASQQPYLTMTTQEKNSAFAGQYEYAGQISNMHSYHWTLHAITDEQYTLSEENYGVDDYDVTTIIVQYYTDETGASQIRYIYGDSTSGFEEKNIPPVTGGQTTAVSFNNLYTKTGTGALAIVKRDSTTTDNDVTGKLQDAVFGLYESKECTTLATDGDDNKLVATSNANGTAYFNNLTAGTYYLQEIVAPEGYQAVETVWKVEVTQQTDGSIKVTLYEPDESGNGWKTNGTVCYDGGNGGLLDSFTVPNEANSTTVTVTKTFEGLTTSELKDIVDGSYWNVPENQPAKDGYYIQVSGPEGSEGDVRYLTLREATPSQDQKTFTWTLHDIVVTDDEDNLLAYTITEYNCGHASYKDIAVTAAVNGVAVPEVQDGATQDGAGLTMKRGDETGAWAVISNVIFEEKVSDTVRITNRYTNTFDLRLTKVDSDTEAPLAGAEFDIYGPYGEATNTSKKITYTEIDPVTGAQINKTVYFIQTITSGEDGVAVQKGLQLSEGDNTFVYVLNEAAAPDGYARDPVPKVITVNVTSNDYTAAGVYAVQAPNTQEAKAKLTLTAVKEWDPAPLAGAEVTLELYRVEHTERNVPLENPVEATLLSSVRLDGTVDPRPDNGTEGYESAPWTATWTDIPTAPNDGDNYGKGINETHYHYFVREVAQLDGYVTSYTCYLYDGTDVTEASDVQALQKLSVDGTEIDAVLIADMAEVYDVTVTNTSHFELPDSGGSGTLWYTAGGLALSAAALLYGYRRSRRTGRRSKR